ncbi:MAG: ATP--guanido phosphotransferase, partial [bacterium]|nr:ATP--guanido phosphotransferase [bacterium]
RVRLARNYHDLPFSTGEQDAALCVSRAQQALPVGEDGYRLYRLAELNELDCRKLVERHWISRDLTSRADAGAALIRRDGHVSVMVNEEDHLRIQSIVSGLALDRAAEEAFLVEEMLESVCTFSFDPQLGYLTSCPTNTGTGMRASLMLHLPMLTRYKQMGNVNQSVAKLGLTTRGIYGEGSEALGDLYQVSNQVTLGRTEEEIIEAVTAVGKQLIDMEQALRHRCLKEQSIELRDALNRSYGLLRYAVRMGEKEFMQHWSNLRLGAALGLFSTPLDTVDGLLSTAQEAHAELWAQERGNGITADCARCEIIHKALAASN